MVKMVLKDWISGRRQAWKELWKKEGVGAQIIIASSGGVSWTGIYREFSIFGKIALIIQILMIPIVICLHTMYPNRLSKPMYMAPLEKEEKQKYLFTAFMIKVVSITVLQCGISLFLVLAGWLPVINGVLIPISLFLFNLTIGFQTNSFETGWDLLVLVMFLINYIGLVFTGDAPMEYWEVIISCITFTLQTLACVGNIKKQYKSSMEKALDYERIYVIKKDGLVQKYNKNREIMKVHM